MTDKLISKYIAQKKISLVWLATVAVYIILFVIISGYRKNSGKTTEHIEWLISYIGPVLSLITSAFVYSANNRQLLENKQIDIFFYRLVMLASIFYLGFLMVILLTTPFVERQQVSFMEHLKSFSLILGFIQSTIVVFLGIFFVKEEH